MKTPNQNRRQTWERARFEPYFRRTDTSPKPATRPNVACMNKDMETKRLASRNLTTKPIEKRTTFKCPEDKDDSSSVVSSNLDDVVIPSLTSVFSSMSLLSVPDDRSQKQDDKYHRKDSPKRKTSSATSHNKGNHYALSKIVGYLQTHTLASYFRNPTEEDKMTTSGLGYVTKSLMAASVVHLGGRHNRHSDSYLWGLRKGLTHASERHENLLEKRQGPPGISEQVCGEEGRGNGEAADVGRTSGSFKERKGRQLGSARYLKGTKPCRGTIRKTKLRCKTKNKFISKTNRKTGITRKTSIKFGGGTIRNTDKKTNTRTKYGGGTNRNTNNQPKTQTKFGGGTNRNKNEKSNIGTKYGGGIDRNTKKPSEIHTQFGSGINGANKKQYKASSRSNIFEGYKGENEQSSNGIRQQWVKPHLDGFGVRICSLEQLKQLEALGHQRFRKSNTSRSRHSSTPANVQPNGAFCQRKGPGTPEANGALSLWRAPGTSPLRSGPTNAVFKRTRPDTSAYFEPTGAACKQRGPGTTEANGAICLWRAPGTSDANGSTCLWKDPDTSLPSRPTGPGVVFKRTRAGTSGHPGSNGAIYGRRRGVRETGILERE